jgi:ABC-type Fe3+ transport system permease subunit
MDEQQDQQIQTTSQVSPPSEPRETSSLPPPNYLVWAILTTVFCCLPFGIVSLIYAAQVNSKWASGDIEGAKLSSKNARTWAWVAFAVGIALALVSIILSIFGVIAGLGLEAFDSLDI